MELSLVELALGSVGIFSNFQPCSYLKSLRPESQTVPTTLNPKPGFRVPCLVFLDLFQKGAIMKYESILFSPLLLQNLEQNPKARKPAPPRALSPKPIIRRPEN